MEGIFYQYNNDFIKSGEVFKDKTGALHRLNKNKNGELRGGQLSIDKDGNLLMARYIDENSNVQTTIYKDGEIHSKFQEKVIDGKFVKSGEYEEYEKGIVIKKGQYNNGLLDGEWYMLNGEKNKIIGKKYKNGKDISEEAKKELKENIDNLANETVEALTENDLVRATQRLGKNIVKLAQSFNKKENMPQIKINFKEMPELEPGKIEKCYSTFYKDGSPKIFAEEAILDDNKNLKFKGNYIEHHDNGRIKIKGNYNENFKLDGAYREYFENGLIKSEGNYKNGEKIGIHKIYDEDGIEIFNKDYSSPEKRKEKFKEKSEKNRSNYNKAKFVKNILKNKKNTPKDRERE